MWVLIDGFNIPDYGQHEGWCGHHFTSKAITPETKGSAVVCFAIRLSVNGTENFRNSHSHSSVRSGNASVELSGQCNGSALDQMNCPRLITPFRALPKQKTSKHQVSSKPRVIRFYTLSMPAGQSCCRLITATGKWHLRGEADADKFLKYCFPPTTT